MRPEISIVTTLYRSESFLDEFIAACYEVAGRIAVSFEIVLVNDGSPDQSLEKALKLKTQYPAIKAVNLSRNFGHHYALLAGMNVASGDYIFNIDCDLEVNPAILFSFYKELKEGGYDVVYGFQEKRKGQYLERKFGGWFWKLFNLLSETKIPENVLTERLMSRRFVDHLISLEDRNVFLAGMMYWPGFNQKGIPVAKGLRKGKSTYTLSKRIKLLIEAISSFSPYPLKLLFKTGMLLTVVSFLLGSYFLIHKLVNPSKILTGFTSLIVVILFSTGLIMTSLGVIGIYLEKIFNQVRNRPTFIIEKIYE